MNPVKARNVLLVAAAAVFLVVGLCPSPAACLQTAAAGPSQEQRERIAASFVLALGRLPTASEIDEWAKTPGTVAELLARHRERLRRDAASRQAVASKAEQDAFGPGAATRARANTAGDAIYTDLMKGHVEWLAAHAQDYQATVHRAYRVLLQRDAYDVEIDYWKRQPALPFALLVGCLDDWARRNQPGLTATTGVAAVSVNSEHLATVRLSPAIASEARAAVGLVPDDEAARGVDRHVVAAGAAHLVSVGGIHFAAAGAPAQMLPKTSSLPAPK